MSRDEVFSEFVAARWPRLVRSAVLLGCSQAEAEDLAQTTLERCLMKWSKVQRDQGQDLVFPRAQLGSTLVGCRDEPPLDTRLLAVRHVSGSGDVRYLHAANWMIIAELRQTPSDSAKPTSGTHDALTNQEYAFARDLARQEIRRQEDATVTSATVTVSRGKVTDSNIGYSCRSGRLLHIKLIGNFPHIVISPLDSAKPGTAPPDPTVHAVVLTADANTGRPCLSGVQTGDVAPDPGAISLPLD